MFLWVANPRTSASFVLQKWFDLNVFTHHAKQFCLHNPQFIIINNNKSNTSIIAERSYNSPDNDLLPAEQKGYRRGSYGCKDQLLINKAILEEATSKRKNLSTAWIDYKKAFDSVSHSWIKKCHEICRIYPTTIKFVTESMKLFFNT